VKTFLLELKMLQVPVLLPHECIEGRDPRYIFLKIAAHFVGFCEFIFGFSNVLLHIIALKKSKKANTDSC
jgi:hypothetical protein